MGAASVQIGMAAAGAGSANTVNEALRVLAVDDSEAQRKLVRFSLESREDFHVIGDAANGREAIAAAREWQPDVILLDLNMPVMGGLEALPHILEDSPRSNVIVLSHQSAQEAESSALEQGAAAYIQKPGDFETLPALIMDVLYGPQDPSVTSRPRILVAGYNAQTRDGLVDAFEQGLQGDVVACSTAEEGLLSLEAERFDLIVCGQRMPGMDGVAFLGRTRSLARGVPRIMFARGTDAQVSPAACDAGATLFIPRAKYAPDQSAQDLVQRMRRLLFAISASRPHDSVPAR